MVETNYCVDDDGMLSGSAYFLTTRATQWSIREWLQELKKISSEENELQVSSTKKYESTLPALF